MSGIPGRPILSLAFPLIAEVLQRVIPDKEAAAKAAREIEDKFATAEVQALLAQLEINKAEATNPNVFVAGWRPFIGWIGGLGFAVQFVFVPLVGYVYSLFGETAPPPVALDPILYQVILGLLGLAVGTRTYEKVKGVATK